MPDERRPDDVSGSPTTRSATFGETMKAVAWSFFGVRKSADHERDAARLNPVHVIVAGLVGALLFVLVLIAIVKTVVK